MKLFGSRKREQETDFDKLMRENKKLLEMAMNFERELKGAKGNDKH